MRKSIVYNFSCKMNSNINASSCTSDVDECTLNLDDCHDQAMCNNTPGSFSCACNTGWTGNGTVCEGTSTKHIVKNIFGYIGFWNRFSYERQFLFSDVDECTLNLDDCNDQVYIYIYSVGKDRVRYHTNYTS